MERHAEFLENPSRLSGAVLELLRASAERCIRDDDVDDNDDGGDDDAVPKISLPCGSIQNTRFPTFCNRLLCRFALLA